MPNEKGRNGQSGRRGEVGVGMSIGLGRGDQARVVGTERGRRDSACRVGAGRGGKMWRGLSGGPGLGRIDLGPS